MKGLSAKNKIIILGLAWAVLSLSMFFYFFQFLDYSNQKAVKAIVQQKSQLAVLESQKNSYVNAQSDLAKLASLPIQPEDFFSRDVTLVNEIKTLEYWSTELNLTMQISGLSGVASSEPKASTLTSIVQVPYDINLSGSFANVTSFMQVLENLSFITKINTISISAGAKGLINANLGASFYLRD